MATNQTEPIRLNLGSGHNPMHGYINIDINHPDKPHPTGVAMRTGGVYPLDYEDGTVDEIRASHVLEHFGHREAPTVLADWARALKPGGLLKIAVPDFNRIVDHYARGTAEAPIESWLMGGQTDENDYHGAIYQRQKLETMMRAAGIRGIHDWQGDQDCSGLPVSLNLCGRKMEVTKADLKRDITAVMTRPRFIESNGADAQERLLVATGIRMLRSGGVFWTQGISNMIEQAIYSEPPPKYILTIDYDTIFRPEDVIELYALMEAMPEANAMIPLQMRRDSIYPLLTAGEKEPGAAAGVIDADAVDRSVMPIRSGHFGLTLIRTTAIEAMERPWFQASTAPDGGWGNGRVDADVNFWLKMPKIYMANRVVVGHAQQVITWPSPSLQPIHQYVPDYNRHGKPPEAI